MALSHWKHPKTGSPRLYVHQALAKNAGIPSQKGDKLWFEPAPNDRGWKLQCKGLESLSKTDMQAALLTELGMSAPGWDELLCLAETNTAHDGEAPPDKGLRQRGPKPVSHDASRAKDARKLKLSSIKMPAAVTIEVDHREPSLLPELLDQHELITTERVTLELADFRVQDHQGNELLIERKRCVTDTGKSDFEASLTDDGRLFDQSERLQLKTANAEHQVIPVIILEGDVYAGAPNLLVQQIDGAISFLAAVRCISVLCAYNANHSAYLIAKLCSHFQDGLYDKVSLHKRKPRALNQQQLYVLESLPGVSSVLAEELLLHFGSLERVVSASAAQLNAVPGMGPKKIKALRRVFTGDPECV